MGDTISLRVHANKVCKHATEELITTFEMKTAVMVDEVEAGGCISLIIGRGLPKKARVKPGLAPCDIFRKTGAPVKAPRVSPCVTWHLPFLTSLFRKIYWQLRRKAKSTNSRLVPWKTEA
jgi:hypothetical protein